MRSAYRRARWALAAAGSVTLALTGLAQTKPASDAKAPPDNVPPEKAAVEAEISPSLARLAEIKVELAWLGDRATFPCQLAARRVGGKLEVGGFVPDESLRKKALDLARSNCELSVVDKLLVHPGSAMAIARASHEELSRAAAAVLGRLLAKHNEEFSFETDPSGEITIKGLIPTWEDKLTVSRRLSQLPGCTGVVNQFRVRNQMRDGQLCNLVSIDGKLRVPAVADAVADLAAPRPAVFTETVQRIEAPGAVPLLPTEAPSAVAQGPVLPPAGPSIAVAVSPPSSTPKPTPVFSKPVATSPVVTMPANSTPLFVPSAQSKPVVAPPVVSHSAAPATVVLKKEATPLPVSKPAVVANNSANPSRNSGLNGAPLKLPTPFVLGSNSPVKPTSTVANVVSSPALPSKPVAAAPAPSKPVTTKSVATAIPAKPAVNPNAKQPGTAIQLVGYQEPVAVNPSVNQPASQPAINRYSSPYGGGAYASNVYGGSPYGASPAPANPYSGSAGVRSASSNPYAAGSPYGAVPATPMPVSTPSPGLIARAWAAAPVSQPVQVVQVTPVPTALSQPVTATPAAPVTVAAPAPLPVTNWGTAPAPVAPKYDNPVPSMLPGNVVSAPVVPAPVARLGAASPVVPVAAQRIAPTPMAGPVTSAEVQGFLANRIQEIGEGKVRDLRVQGTASNSCVISLTVPSAIDGQQVGQKIINMPELVPYKVDLQIRVQP